MRELVSTPKHVGTSGRLRVVASGGRVPTLPNVDEETELSDVERRRRLSYIIRDRMFRLDMKPAELARRMGVPRTNLDRWIDPQGSMPMIWLGPLCKALAIDPMVVAELPEIPPDPLERYVVDEDVVAVATDAAALASLDPGPAEEAAPPAAAEHPAPRRRRAAQGSR